MDAYMKTPSELKTTVENGRSITLFFFEPTTWHGRVCCLIQRALGFKRPYSHVVLGTDTDDIVDFTTDGIEVFSKEDNVWLTYYSEAADARSYVIPDESYADLITFLSLLLDDDFKIRWFAYAYPTLAYMMRINLRWVPVSCTSLALITLPIYTHPLAFLPAVLSELLDNYERSELQ